VSVGKGTAEGRDFDQTRRGSTAASGGRSTTCSVDGSEAKELRIECPRDGAVKLTGRVLMEKSAWLWVARLWYGISRKPDSFPADACSAGLSEESGFFHNLHFV